MNAIVTKSKYFRGYHEWKEIAPIFRSSPKILLNKIKVFKTYRRKVIDRHFTWYQISLSPKHAATCGLKVNYIWFRVFTDFEEKMYYWRFTHDLPANISTTDVTPIANSYFSECIISFFNQCKVCYSFSHYDTLIEILRSKLLKCSPDRLTAAIAMTNMGYYYRVGLRIILYKKQCEVAQCPF